MKLIDLTGKRFGRWTVLRRSQSIHLKQPYWECRCDCGMIQALPGASLRSGATRSCRNCAVHARIKNLNGKRFGRLIALKIIEMSKAGSVWQCKCDCGEMCTVKAHSLISNHTKSCGCLRRKPNIDLTGRRFGKLVVTSVGNRLARGIWSWKCLCDCGNECEVRGNSLTTGNTVSCGCHTKQLRQIFGKINVKENLAGKRFGRWLVLRRYKNTEDGRYRWICRCDCEAIKAVMAQALRNGDSVSCGCYMREKARQPKGEKAWNYNPELTAEERIARRDIPSNDRWRMKILERDNYTCQKCNKRGGRLIAHHLEGWNRARDMRFIVSNGVTLCRKCHFLFHRIYGRGNNTKTQYKEFISSTLTNRKV
jgi:hypothetical protein